MAESVSACARLCVSLAIPLTSASVGPGFRRPSCRKERPSFVRKHYFCAVNGYSPPGTGRAEVGRMRLRPTRAGAMGRPCGKRTVSRLMPASVLLSLAIGACGANSGAEGAVVGGASQAGGSSTGASGMSHGGTGGASGAGGRNAGVGGLVEVCLVCAGNGVGGHAGSVSLAGSGGSITTGAAGTATAAAGTSGGGGVGCGDRTCGPNQYCRAACSGVAWPSAGTGGRPTPGEPTCAELPAACGGVATCSCICGPTSSFCTPGAAEVQCGCG